MQIMAGSGRILFLARKKVMTMAGESTGSRMYSELYRELHVRRFPRETYCLIYSPRRKDNEIAQEIVRPMGF